jgi:hypothetical protein
VADFEAAARPFGTRSKYMPALPGTPGNSSRMRKAPALGSSERGVTLRWTARIGQVEVKRLSPVTLAPRGWLLGRCLSLADYVIGTGATRGVPTAGGR